MEASEMAHLSSPTNEPGSNEKESIENTLNNLETNVKCVCRRCLGLEANDNSRVQKGLTESEKASECLNTDDKDVFTRQLEAPNANPALRWNVSEGSPQQGKLQGIFPSDPTGVAECDVPDWVDAIEPQVKIATGETCETPTINAPRDEILSTTQDRGIKNHHRWKDSKSHTRLFGLHVPHFGRLKDRLEAGQRKGKYICSCSGNLCDAKVWADRSKDGSKCKSRTETDSGIEESCNQRKSDSHDERKDEVHRKVRA